MNHQDQVDSVQPGEPGYYPPVSASQHVSQKTVKQSRDRAQYVRQQKGHSLILNLLIVGPITFWITTIYYSVSPNHYWHA